MDGLAVPFVLQFYGNPSSYLWTDDSGVTHGIWQGEGGEQGDPLTPMLHALGQHQASVLSSPTSTQESLFSRSMKPERVGDTHNLLGNLTVAGASCLPTPHCLKLHAWRTQRRSPGSVIWKIERKREASASSAPHWVRMNSSGCNRGSSSCSVQFPRDLLSPCLSPFRPDLFVHQHARFGSM